MSGDAERYCIVGAGPAGLCAARAFSRAGLAYDQFERHDDVGGMWDIRNPWSPMYDSAHMISTRRSTELPEFPMPREAADYPSHTVVAEYFRDFAKHFGLYESIRFGTGVERVRRRDSLWEVTLHGGERRLYRGVVVANGHQSEPKLPRLAGRFDGESFHSLHHRSPEVFRDKRVLVVGAGNSGCDIVLDAVHFGRRAMLSMRRGYHIVPKYGPFGIPMGDLNSAGRMPRGIQLRLARFVLRLLVGHPARFGIPEPDHELAERHAIVNSQLLYHAGHGDLTIKPDVRRLLGDRVEFADGSTEPVDLIVYATGYRLHFPFLDPDELEWREETPRLYLHAFHPQPRDLFFVGLIESTDGGNWRLFAAQAELIAGYLELKRRQPARVTDFERRRAAPPGFESGCARPYYVNNAPYLRALNEVAGSLGLELQGAQGSRPASASKRSSSPGSPSSRGIKQRGSSLIGRSHPSK